MSDRLGKVIHVEGGFTVVEVVEEQGGSPAVVGYSLFGIGTDIRKVYSRDGAIAALRERLAAA